MFLPGSLVLLAKRFGVYGSIPKLFVIAASQLVFGFPFYVESASKYIGQAFNFGRKFFYVWTVNLRFLPEETFKSDQVAKLLLALHVVFLIMYGMFRWIKYVVVA